MKHDSKIKDDHRTFGDEDDHRRPHRGKKQFFTQCGRT